MPLSPGVWRIPGKTLRRLEELNWLHEGGKVSDILRNLYQGFGLTGGMDGGAGYKGMETYIIESAI